MKALKSIRNGSPRERTLRMLREQLANGVWGGGERLPGEEQIATDIGVSRPTVRVVLSILEDEGLIRSLGRAGRVVVGEPTPATPGVMANTLVVLSNAGHEPPPGYHGGSNEAVESGIQDEANRCGLNMMRIHRDHLLPQTTDWLFENRPAAILLTSEMACEDWVKALVARLAGTGVPVVSSASSAALSACDLVLFDHDGGAAALTRWLVSQGCRRILPFWGTTHSFDWLTDRHSGYVRAMHEAGLTPMEPVRCDFPSRPAERNEVILQQRIRLSLGYLFEHLCSAERVDAVMLMEDSSVYPFLGACQLAGVKTGPGGILFTGFDNFWSECWEREVFPLKDLATIDKQNYLAGQEMVRMVMRRRDDPQAERVVLRIPSQPCLPL